MAQENKIPEQSVKNIWFDGCTRLAIVKAQHYAKYIDQEERFIINSICQREIYCFIYTFLVGQKLIPKIENLDDKDDKDLLWKEALAWHKRHRSGEPLGQQDLIKVCKAIHTLGYLCETYILKE